MIAVETVKDARKGPDIDRELRPNAVTLAAMQETRDMMDGTIKAEWNHPHKGRIEGAIAENVSRKITFRLTIFFSTNSRKRNIAGNMNYTAFTKVLRNVMLRMICCWYTGSGLGKSVFPESEPIPIYSNIICPFQPLA